MPVVPFVVRNQPIDEYRFLTGENMRVTSKGQVTIPLEIRKKLNITPGSEVQFIVVEDGRVTIEKVETEDGTVSRFTRLRGVATIKMTTEEIMTLTRGKT